MSPAYTQIANTNSIVNDSDPIIFCWVGIIMYLPPGQSDQQRRHIQNTFDDYCRILQPLMKEFGAVPHWGKLYPPSPAASTEQQHKDLLFIRNTLRERYPLELFNRWRATLDRNNILGTNLLNDIFDDP